MTSYLLFLLLALSGGLIALSGVISFRRGHTTVNPTKPESSSSLVTSGVYRFTRNPMYLGFALFLAGWALFLGNLYSLALVIPFVVYMNRFQIKPEEQALAAIFGEEFTAYTHQVRRWV